MLWLAVANKPVAARTLHLNQDGVLDRPDSCRYMPQRKCPATGDGTTNANLKWFNWTDGNTYIVEGLTATSTALAATDNVVKLIGTYDLSSSTVSAAGLFTFV